MYPEESYANAQPKKSRKKLFLIIGAAIVVIIILLLSFAGSQSVDNANIDDPGYKVTSTDLIPAAYFSTIQGNDLYSYNGLAFYKVNLDNSNNVTILRSGLKLPTPASITWAGSNGALLTFKQSFSNTIVSNALRASGLSLDKLTQAYVWYLDFGSGKLTLVNKIPVQSGKPYYDEAAKGIYYVSRTERIFKLTLHFFNIQTSKDELAVPDLDSAGIESLSKCSPDFKLCFIARDRSNATESSRQLYAIDSNNRKISVYDPKGGRIFATSKPDLYITTAAEEVRSSTDKPGAPTEDTDFSSAIAQSYDVASKSSSDLRPGRATRAFRLKHRVLQF